MQLPLTTGIDTIVGNSNMNVQGTGTTFTQYDSITGSAFNDSLTINDSTGASASGVPAGVAVTGIETMNVNSNGSIGKVAVAAGTAVSGTAQVFTSATEAVTAATTAATVTMVINGQTYSAVTANPATQANIAGAIQTILTNAFGGAVSLSAITTGGFTATSATTGTNLGSIGAPVITGTVTGGASTIGQTTAPVAAAATNAIAEIETITFAGATLGPTDVYYAQVNGRSVVAYTGTTQATAATQVAAQINALYGSTIATAVGSTVTITGPAGVVLPAISAVVVPATAGGATATTAVVSSAATATTAAVAGVTYDVSGFTGLTTYNASSSGGENVKVAATTDLVARNINGGDVVIDGGKVVTVTTAVGTAAGTTTSAVSVSGKALTSVSITGGTGATVNNKENTTAATDNGGSTLTAVSLTSVDGDSTVGGKGLVNVTVAGATTAARTVTITNSTANHTQNLTLNNTGYTSADAAVKTVVTDAAARTLNVISSGTKNLVDLTGNTAATALNISGAGKLTADVSIALLAAIDGSAATGALVLGTLNAATLAVTTGTGADTMTIAATAATTVRTGAGNDVVTLGSTVAAGSTIDLGADNDTLLSSSGSVATGASSAGVITKIDGGAGTDTLAASLVNNGNKALFTNFEVLALDLTTSGTFDTTLVTGLTGLSLVSAGGGTYTGVTTAQALTISNTATPTGTTTLTMTGVSGTADSYSISFAGADQTAIPSVANVLGGTFAIAGIENFNIVSGGGVNTWNSLTLAADANANTVTITGAKNLNLAFDSISSVAFGSVTAPLTGVSSIDGSAATGKLAINIANVVPNATGLVVKGGSGVDTITTSSTAYGTLFGGGGADSFVVYSTVAASTSAPVYNTIADITLADTIKLATTGTAQTTLGAAESTASATSLTAALTAIAASSDVVSWGTYGGNTYVVWDHGNDGFGTADVVVALTGTVSLATSSYSTAGVLTIA